MDNENNCIKMKNSILTIAILTMVFANVSAFAISSQYWEENPIEMTAGETVEIEILLQNLAGSEDIYAQGSIIESSEIAQFADESDEYLIEAGEKTFAKVRITIPDKDPMEKYNLVFSFKTSEEGTGSFGLGNSVEREIPIVVTKKPSFIDETSKTWIIGILAVGVIVLSILFIKNQKKKKKKK